MGAYYMGKRASGDNRPSRTWHEGIGDQTQEHFEVRHGKAFQPVLVLIARIWATKSGPHTVEIFRDHLLEGFVRDLTLQSLKGELDLYLKKDERNICQYLKHHCTTASNVYSYFHWAFIKRACVRSKPIRK
ncbi:protein of unknown function [Nitrospira japonica]|uniref:Uncharacterized protein n=1 Tax=Nitrospira japonica TaxID=1325564 RepID=A0A1W1I3F0_9BACT|nr:protein of unknown function [Nitrospira japonica]